MTAVPTGEFRGTLRFTVEARIGVGGMGVVYRAYDHERQRTVAIKTLRNLEASALYRLKREFRALAGLVHPNLVSLYELFSLDDCWFFTMELIEGVDFLTYVRGEPRAIPSSEPPGLPPSTTGTHACGTETGLSATASDSELSAPSPAQPMPPLNANQSARLFSAIRQLAQGVSALHGAGKLHRDIKPSNVLVTREGRVVLLDFGLATELEPASGNQTTFWNVVGTFLYMSPEQAAGAELTPASDWYSVGAILYEAMTGRQPFTGSPLHVLRIKQDSEPVPPQQLAAGAPGVLNDLCVDLLRCKPSQRPSGAEICSRLGLLPSTGAPSPPSTAALRRTPFVGRQTPLQALREAYGTVGRGKTALVYVSGRSGVGKTALVQHFLEEIQGEPETVVLTGRCYERESVPYKAFDSLVDSLSHYLIQLPRWEADAFLPGDVPSLLRVFPVLRRVEAIAQVRGRDREIPDRQELRQRAFAALRELLTRLGDRKRLVLHIDDLQWGDLDSAALLRDLLRPPDSPLLLLIISYRSEDRQGSPVLRALFEERFVAGDLGVRSIDLLPLDDQEARSLALALMGDDGDSQHLSQAIARESGGNPYFVDTLVHHLESHRGLVETAGPSEALRLEDVLWARIYSLPVEARRLLEVVAVAGHPVQRDDACRAAESVSDDDAVAELCSARMLRVTKAAVGDQLECYHDRVRETAVSRLSPDTLRRCHRRLAEVLKLSEHVDPATMASHFLGAEQPQKAGEYYALAADEAAEMLAFDHAANLYGLALQLRPSDHEEQRPLRQKMADALANAGRGAEAAREYLTAAHGASAAESLELQRNAAVQYLVSGHIDEGLETVRNVLAAVGMKLPPNPRRGLWSLLLHRAQLRLRGLHFRERDETQVAAQDLRRIDVCWSVASGLSVVDTIRAADFQVRGLLLALRCGEPYRVARSLALEAGYLATNGCPARKRVDAVLAQALSLGERLANAHVIGFTSTVAGVSAFLQGRWQTALELCDQGQKTLKERSRGVAWELNTAKGFGLWALFYLGEMAEMARRLPALMAEAQERNDLYALAFLGSFVRPMLALAADEPERAGEEIRELANLWSQEGFHVQHFNFLYGQTMIDLYRGQDDSARKRLADQWPALSRSLLLRIQQVRTIAHHMRARVGLAATAAAAKPATLRREILQDVRRLERERTPWASALAVLTRAGLAIDAGDTGLATQTLQDASDRLEAVSMKLFAAAARRRLGELLGGDTGNELILQSDALMGRQGIKNPARMVWLFVPGGRPPDDFH